MKFSLPSQDQLSFSAYHTYSMGGATTEGTLGPFQPDGQSLTHYEPTMPWYNGNQSLNSPAFDGTLFPEFFEQSNQATTEDIPTGQPVPPSAYVHSNSTPNVSMGAPVMTSVAPALTIAPPTPTTNATAQGRFTCPLCPKMFDRPTRAEACYNEHLNWKRHMCHGVCGRVNCTAAYFSIENLRRHARVPAKRKVACPYCSRSILKQNISRHKKYCL